LTLNSVILTTTADTSVPIKAYLIVRVSNYAQVSVIVAFELNIRGKLCTIDQLVRYLSLKQKVPSDDENSERFKRI